MTTSTTNLNLTIYNTVTDASSLVNTYINDTSGSSSSNMTKIDAYAGNTSASVTSISTASYVVLSMDSTLTNEKLFSSGSGTTVVTDSAASTVRIDLAYADATQVNSASSATAVVSASSLSQSNYGTKTVCIPLNESTALVGGETRYVRIPPYMNGWKLIDVGASCGAKDGSGSSTSGSPSFNLQRSSASSMTLVGLLTNLVVIDQGEFDSSTSASPAVLAAVRTVSTGDKIWATTSASGTGVTYVQVSPTFQNQP